MLITKDNTYKIMEFDKIDFETYEEMGFFECDKSGNKIVEQSTKKTAKKTK